MKQTELFEKELKKQVGLAVEPSLWRAFLKTCEAQHVPGSFVIREFMRDYIEKKQQFELIKK